jgi:hypothetical protein
MPLQGLVARVCLSSGHLAPYVGEARRSVVPSTAVMTIVDRQWAFCLAGGPDGHEWVTLDPKASVHGALVFMARPKGALVVSSPKTDASHGTPRAKGPSDGPARRRDRVQPGPP